MVLKIFVYSLLVKKWRISEAIWHFGKLRIHKCINIMYNFMFIKLNPIQILS